MIFFPRLIWFWCTGENTILSPETWDTAPGLVPAGGAYAVVSDAAAMLDLVATSRRSLECCWEDLQMFFGAKHSLSLPSWFQVCVTAEAGLQLEAGPAGSIWQVELGVAWASISENRDRGLPSCHLAGVLARINVQVHGGEEPGHFLILGGTKACMQLPQLVSGFWKSGEP